MRTARKRRQLQSLYFSVAGGGAVVLLATFIGAQLLGLSSPVAPLKTQSLGSLPFQAQGPAALAASGPIWVGAQNAALWKIAPDGQATRFFESDFGSQTAPLPFVVNGHSRVAWSTLDGKIRVFDARKNVNAPLWTRDLGAPISTKMSVVNDTLLCATDAGKIAALDAQNGATRWGTALGAPVGEALTLTTNGVLVPTLGGARWRGGLVHLNRQNGAILWRFPENSNAHAAGVCAPFFDASANRVFWANDEGAVFALSAQNGEKIWKTFAVSLDAKANSTGKPVVLRGAPVLLDGTVFVGGNDGVLRAFDAQNGDLQWSANLGAPITTPVQSAGDLAIWARTQTGDAFVIGRASGEILRRSRLSPSAVWNESSGFDFSSRGELVKLQIS